MNASVKSKKSSGKREAEYRKQGPLPADHPAVKTGKVGVLLVNLGTPDGHDKKNMRRYLEEFLTDARVIEWPKLLWYPILYGIVLNTRPKKSGAAYETIWNKELDESPLRTITRSQSDKLAAALAGHDHVIVDWGMRYGKPSIAARLEALQAQVEHPLRLVLLAGDVTDHGLVEAALRARAGDVGVVPAELVAADPLESRVELFDGGHADVPFRWSSVW